MMGTTKAKTSGLRARQQEATTVRKTLRAAAVGRLLLGELSDWAEFLAPDTTDFASMPRRRLRALHTDARRRLDQEIQGFCNENFDGMTMETLSRLFEAIKARRGLEQPRIDFESSFAPFKRQVVAGAPMHATVVISLWGLQFWVPEADLASDLAVALGDANSAMQALGPHYEARSHARLSGHRSEIRIHLRRSLSASRSGLLAAFNLVECYTNSLAWEYLRTGSAVASLSSRRRRLLEDASGTTLRDKLFKYPEIIAEQPLPDDARKIAEALLDVMKPFRDSLVHPSPFEAPEKFGGYDKLRNLYRIDISTLWAAAHLAVDVIEKIQAHLGSVVSLSTPWLADLRDALEQHKVPTPPDHRGSRWW